MEEQTNEQSEELEELDLFVWSEEDLAKPLEQSPKFDYMKSIGDNFRKIKDKDKKNTEAINNKVSIEEGKGLSTNDFTNTYKQKLDELQNYDDTEVVQEIRKLQQENTILKQTQDDIIEKQLNKETEADTSVIAKDSDEFYGKLSIFGGQRQEKRQGYNLLKLVDKTKNVFGLTHVIKDGKITSTGTSTKSYADIGSDRDSFEIKLEAEKTYTFMRTEASFCSIAIKLYSDKNDLTSFETFTIPTCQTKTTFAPTRNTEFCYLFLGSFTAGTEFNLKEYGVMVYEGTENKEFEQYGVMPSLNYSSEIQSVGDVKYNLELGTILAVNGGNADNNTRVRIKEYIKVVPGAECIIDAEGIDEVVVFEYDKDKKYLFRVGWEKIPYTFNLSENTRYIRYIFRKKDNSVLTVDSVKDKSKHLRSVEITTSNKNMYDKSKITEGILISVTGTSSNNSHFNLSDFIKVRTSTTYTFSRDESEKAESQFLVLEYDTKKNFIRRRGNVSNNTNKLTFITSENTKFVRLQYRVDYAYTDLQFEEEESRTEYTTHRGETLTMPIQQSMFEGDTFEKIDGVWYEKHCKKEKTITGNDIQSVSSNNRVFFKISSVPGFKKISEEFYYGNIDKNTIESNVATSLTGHSLTWLATAKKGDWISSWNNPNDANGFVLRTDKEFATKEEAIIYFNENPFTVVYELLEIEYIKCTEEQCKILDKIDTYKDGTIITTDNDLCKISLRYKQNLESRIEQIEKQLATQAVAEGEE